MRSRWFIAMGSLRVMIAWATRWFSCWHSAGLIQRAEWMQSCARLFSVSSAQRNPGESMGEEVGRLLQFYP